jgi:hypothetical protein
LIDYASHVSNQNMRDIHTHAFKHGMDASCFHGCHELLFVAMNLRLTLPICYLMCLSICLWWYNFYLLDDLNYVCSYINYLSEANFNCDDELMIL